MPRPIFRVSVLVPVYHGAEVLPRALDSLVHQDFPFHEIIVGDDNGPEDQDEITRTQAIVNRYRAFPMRYYKNEQNIGSARNIQRLVSEATGDILFFLCQDDILAHDALQKTHDAFLLGEDIGGVTRPYFLFDADIRRPLRAIQPYARTADALLSLTSGKRAFVKIFESLGQISGLAYRRAALAVPFGADTFTGHITAFAGVLRAHRVVFLKDYTVAVPIRWSQTRHRPDIYAESPTEQWMRMYATAFPDEAYRHLRAWGNEHMARHFVGLIQVRAFGGLRALLRELRTLTRARPKNLLDPAFWGVSLLSLLAPGPLLWRSADLFKEHILSRVLPTIPFLPANEPRPRAHETPKNRDW